MKSRDEIFSLLRPHQKKSVERILDILRSADSAVDASETGVGKTFVGCAVATALQIPTLVVVPKISITSWHRAAEVFEDRLSVINYERLRAGNTLFGQWENQSKLKSGANVFQICEICQQRVEDQECPYHHSGIHCVTTKKAPVRYGKFIFNPAVKFVIWDECHRCGAMKSLNAEMLIACKRQKIKHLLLSATIAQSPLQMRAIGYSLDLFDL